MKALKLLGVMILPVCLSGCVTAAVVAGLGAGAMSGSMAYDHRSVGHQVSDRSISNKAHDTLIYDSELYGKSHISVAVYNGTLLLVGEAQTPELKKRAEQIIASHKGIKKIYNEITISGSESTIAKLDDTWITSKVKTMMLRRKGLETSQIKVVTENGTVFLMGMVNKNQAGLAADTARRVGGVHKVVEVFDYQS